MSKRLFEDFEGVSSKAWKQKIQADLKGLDYNDTLIHKTNEDIHIKPFYHSDDVITTQTPKSNSAHWQICETIYVADELKSNLTAIDVLKKGADEVKFIIPNNDISIDKLLLNINQEELKLYFELLFLDDEFVKTIVSVTSKAVSVYINTDIIGNLAKDGNWYQSIEKDKELFNKIVNASGTFGVDISLYQNAGATLSQQLAYGMAHANEYLNILESKHSFTPIFTVAVGTNYFFEIAKLRALRLLWSTLATEYDFNTDCIIFTIPTKRNKTVYDYNTNMLRTTTESMSAILGGSNSICNLAYDAIYHKKNEFGNRIARNQLLVLKHESYFDKVDNPVDGSYYIDSLTEQLAEKALSIFKDIEGSGGFLVQLKSGTIQRKLKESAALEQNQFNKEEIILLGTNKHPNTTDKMKHELELYPFQKTNIRKTLIEPILEKRLSEGLEQQRLNQE